MAGSSHSRCWLYHCLIAESGERALETPTALCQRHSFVARLKVLSHSKCSKQNGIIYINAVWAAIWWNIIQTLRQKSILSTGKVLQYIQYWIKTSIWNCTPSIISVICMCTPTLKDNIGKEYIQMLTVTTSDLLDVLYSLYLSKFILHEHLLHFFNQT